MRPAGGTEERAITWSIAAMETLSPAGASRCRVRA